MHGRADDIGRDAAAGIELAAAAELDDRLAHGLAALGDGLDLEIIQLVMAAEDRFDGQKRRVDRAVAQAHTRERLAVL